MGIRLFEDRTFYNKLVKLTLPIAIQSLLLSLVAVADSAMLGRLNQDQMGAVSLATQIQFIQNMILSCVTSTVMILGAQYFSKKDVKRLKDVFGIGIGYVVIISAVTAVGCIVIPEKLMAFFTNDPLLNSIGSGYLRIAGWSYLITGLSQCLITMMKVTDHVSMSATISVVTVVVNVILNGIFIFGLFGFEPMYAKGAALATLIARIIELLIAFSISFQKTYIVPEGKDLIRHERIIHKDFVKCMLPLLGGGLLWGVGFTSYTAIMGHLGSDATAANAVAAVVRDVLCCVCNGICSAGGIIVGNELGVGNLELGKKYGIRLKNMSFVIGFGATVLMLMLTPFIAGYMKLTETAHSYLIWMLVITSFYMIGRCVNTIVINGVFAAGGDTLFDMYSLVVSMWCIAIPLAALGAFVFHWPVLIVFCCTCLDECGKIPWVMYHFGKYKWVKDLTR
ncbi:MAG: MATE family efflux transporter [Clostridia bacterium]|nr:MATE family efflux transporter [Clostridia bacterium]